MAKSNFLKPNYWNSIITLVYIILSWIPVFEIEIQCITAPCSNEILPLVFMFGAGGLWWWLLTVIILYVVISFIYNKLR